MHQYDDEYDTVRGFTTSTSHRDTHYAVGTYEETNIRIVDRFDVHTQGKTRVATSWVILEFEMPHTDLPHAFFIPTGPTSSAYRKVFNANIHMQPLNSTLYNAKHSPEFYGKYQILARTTHARNIEALLTSPVIFGIGEKLWPYGIEIERDKLLIYLSGVEVTQEALDLAFIGGLWLAKEIA